MPLACKFATRYRSMATYITKIVHDCVSFLGIALGFFPLDVSDHCLRVAGATTFLLAQIDLDVICLIG